MNRSTAYFMKLLGAWIAAACLCLGLASAEAADPPGRVVGKLTVKGAKHSGGAVVYLEGVPGGAKPAKKQKMWQRNKQFDPRVMVAVKGAEIEFPNEDKIFHNVFSMSRAARFDLGLYKSGDSKSVKFKRAGVVDVYCNIHPQMVAKILVVENPYYFLTDKDGKFSIDGVPPGTYKVKGWQSYGEPFEGKVTVKAGKATKLDIQLTAGDKAKTTHTRKDGSPYGRYK